MRDPGVNVSRFAAKWAPAVLACAVLLGLPLAPALAFAQSDPTSEPGARAQAARQFEQGSRAFDRGDFVHAAEAFELAYRLMPHVDSLWNAARARQRADELPRAATLYARYLREAPVDARDRNVATAQLVSLAARLGCIEVHGSGVEQLAVDEHPSEERIIYVSPGAHVVRAVVGGALVQQTPELAAGDVVGLVFEAPAPAVSPVVTPAPQVEHSTLDLQSPPPASRGGVSPWFVAGGSVLTGLAVTATIASGLSTFSALDAFNARPTASNLATGESMQARTNVLLGISVGLGVMTVATTIWLVDWHRAPRSDVRLGVGVSRVEAEWRF